MLRVGFVKLATVRRCCLKHACASPVQHADVAVFRLVKARPLSSLSLLEPFSGITLLARIDDRPHHLAR